MKNSLSVWIALAISCAGCQSASQKLTKTDEPAASSVKANLNPVAKTEDSESDSPESGEITLVSAETASEDQLTDESSTVESVDTLVELSSESQLESGSAEPLPDKDANVVTLEDVMGSVYRSYPLLRSAMFARNIAIGQQIGASGAFDTKLKAFSENAPTGFYENYRNGIGVVQPTMWGGEVFAGYRVGRGNFEPWFLERNTNGGGEFKTGVGVPLARNRQIDQRRAELWKADLERQLAEPDIQAQLITFVQNASYSYWDWVAAGENHKIAIRILDLATERTTRIEAQVEEGLIDPQEKIDNERLVAIRKAKVADTRRKVLQTAAKLSVFWRDAAGDPVLLREDQTPGFPSAYKIDENAFQRDITEAISNRPELRYLDLTRRQLDIDYAEARNQLQPEVDALLVASQDVGAPTSSKRDKSEFDGEASIFVDVPLQRRKARGKMAEIEAKVAQIAAKRRITQDKIVVDVQMAYAALISAWEQVQFTEEAVTKAEDLAIRERQVFDEGSSDMLKVTLREQYSVESAEKAIEAMRLYYESQADYRAAIAVDRVQ